MPSGAVPAGVEAASADAGGGRGGVRLRPGGPPLRGSWRPLLSSTATAATADLRSSAPSSPEPGGLVGRRRRTLQEQQHRRPQVKGQATPGGTRTRQARVNSPDSLSFLTSRLARPRLSSFLSRCSSSPTLLHAVR